MAYNVENWEISSIHTLFSFSITYSFTHDNCVEYLLSAIPSICSPCGDTKMKRNGKELILIENLVCA